MVLSAARRFWRYRTPNSAALVSCQSQMKKSPGRVDGLVDINAMALDAAIRGSIFAGPDCLRRENDRVALRLDAGVVTARLRHVRLPDGSLSQLSQGMGCEGRLQKNRPVAQQRPAIIHFHRKVGDFALDLAGLTRKG